MKKSILALGAAAVVGGLGFAGSAHAIAYFGPAAAGGTVPTAMGVELNPGGTGHYLVAPYWSVQGDTGTLFQIANTDTGNGKAVKVRFRGAANSDDVLDFTLFLSPGDVWAGSLSRLASGLGALSSQPGDTTCTLPAGPYVNQPFTYDRTASYLTEENRFAHTREGYMEVLNMADIPPGSDLYTNIKHTNKDASGNTIPWAAPCVSSKFNTLRTMDLTDAAGAKAAGLAAPTGQLMGSWALMNQTQLAVWSGAMTAVQAVSASSTATQAAINGAANIAFAPQMGYNTNLTSAIVQSATADPLLRSNTVTPLWFDLPDMSSPLVGTSAILQARALSDALSKPAIMNEYSAAASPVPFGTDWVVSQPTRRYHAAVNYGTDFKTSNILWNADMTNASSATTTTAPTAALNRYAGLSLADKGAMGPYACLNADFYSLDREEKDNQASPSDSFSPGKPPASKQYCGEVFTMSFGAASSSVLQAQVANTAAPATAGEYGWAKLSLGKTSLPVIGYAASSAVNKAKGGNYGVTIPHRW